MHVIENRSFMDNSILGIIGFTFAIFTTIIITSFVKQNDPKVKSEWVVVWSIVFFGVLLGTTYYLS